MHSSTQSPAFTESEFFKRLNEHKHNLVLNTNEVFIVRNRLKDPKEYVKMLANIQMFNRLTISPGEQLLPFRME